MPFAEDLAQFFNPAELATTAWLDGVQVAGIFSNQAAQAFDAIAAASPSFVLATADCSDTTQESVLQVNAQLVNYSMQGGSVMPAVTGGTSYRVRAIEHSGTGTTTLRLELSA